MFAPGSTLYLGFLTTTGIASTAFTTHLIANGAYVTNIPISISEVSSGVYVASFAAALENETYYTLLIYETATPANQYSGNFYVRSRSFEQDLTMLKLHYL